MMRTMEKAKLYAEVVQSALTSIAIVIGGIWTYQQFIRERPDKGHLIVSQTAQDYAVSAGQTFVQVRIELENVGPSRVLINDGVTRLQQISPLSEKISRAIEGAEPALTKRFNERQTLPWPIICSGHLSSMQRSLEPGEKMVLTQDFLVPRNVRLLRVYSYFEGDVQDDDQSGRWADGIVFPLNSLEKEPTDASVPDVRGTRLVCRNNE
jgi:hypothetical protein